jgi:hypothetical protein
MPDVIKKATPDTQALYRDLLRSVASVGKFKEEGKKTCVHLVRKSAFLGVHPRKQHLLLTVKSPEKLRSPRVFKAEQVSASRWYIDLKVSTPAELDRELLGWIRQSYEMSQ